ADDFRRAIDDALGEAATTEIVQRYGNAFPEAYKEDFGARTAVSDIRRLDQVPDGDIALEFYAPATTPNCEGRLKISRCGGSLALSELVPRFTALGVDIVDERPYQIQRRGSEAWIYDFGVRARGQVTDSDLELFQDAFLACWHKQAEADGFNRLVLA